ncbi:MAG TPA: restriction endonuclease subunit S [Pirellulaceae bacterium]|nr:restriction endonuclease subunit S [Pirellulaceae bacterium]
MIEGLNPYAEYKDSGERWLGQLPASWGLRRAKFLFREIDERSVTGKEELLSVSHKTGVTPRSQKSITMFMAASNVGHKVCRPGDLVINTLWAWMAAMGVSKHTGIVSPAYGVYRPIDTEAFLPSFADQLLRTPFYADEYQRRSTGVNLSRLRLYPEAFLRVPVVLPPPNEQAAIVRFLDHANRKIDGFIQAKRKLIGLLNEQKQAIVLRAVTRGLDPNVPLKPSGIPWIGDIPVHWERRPFVRCCIERADYRGATPNKVESGIFLVTARNIRVGWIDYEASKEFVRAEDYAKIMKRGLPLVDDILLTMEAPLGHVALVDREDIALAQRIIRFRLDVNRLQPRFALFAMNSHYFQNQLLMRATGSTAQGMKASKLPQLALVIPPLKEQSAILSDLACSLHPLNTAIARTEREIALMQEYRTSLTADLVTGKLDVREAAAELPALPADPAGETDDVELLEELEVEEVEA